MVSARSVTCIYEQCFIAEIGSEGYAVSGDNSDDDDDDDGELTVHLHLASVWSEDLQHQHL